MIFQYKCGTLTLLQRPFLVEISYTLSFKRRTYAIFMVLIYITVLVPLDNGLFLMRDTMLARCMQCWVCQGVGKFEPQKT